mgnify:CR=1 FL=1
MFRGAEPLCGCAAQGRKRAGRGYMLPLARVDTGCLAAMNIAACAGVKRYAPRNAVNTAP